MAKSEQADRGSLESKYRLMKVILKGQKGNTTAVI